MLFKEYAILDKISQKIVQSAEAVMLHHFYIDIFIPYCYYKDVYKRQPVSCTTSPVTQTAEVDVNSAS